MKIITVEHLSKCYTIGHDRNSGAIRYKTFRESMMSAGRSLYQRLCHPLSPNREQVELEEFRALDDVSFEVEQGDRIGIIGRNGAGKSTLLKLLCRITEPTKGRITMHGRAASLLEVGTGFHPELSGRENIYLNGAILGMKRAEIKRKFDEIVDFSGVEKFLDTPVKRYSSGMYVRLAFAVAAHLESEILLIDEVLAVGDAEFQKKCLGKMDDISKTEGRTILFVSHNMHAVKELCSEGILLSDGSLVTHDSNINSVIDRYLTCSCSVISPVASRRDRIGNGMLRITEFLVNGISNIQELLYGELHSIAFSFEIFSMIKHPRIAISLNTMGSCIFFLDSNLIDSFPNEISKNGMIEVLFPNSFILGKGRYEFNICFLVQNEYADYIQNICSFNVTDNNVYKNGRTALGEGLCNVFTKWELKNEDRT